MPLNKWLTSRDVIWQSGTEVPKGQALLARKKAKTGSFHFVECWTETLLLRLRTCNEPNGGWVKNGDRPHFPFFSARGSPRLPSRLRCRSRSARGPSRRRRAASRARRRVAGRWRRRDG